jgi:hypothetical protein
MVKRQEVKENDLKKEGIQPILLESEIRGIKKKIFLSQNFSPVGLSCHCLTNDMEFIESWGRRQEGKEKTKPST